MSLLSVTDLDVSLGGVDVLRGISFNVGAGEHVGLVGPNGCGKTTLLRSALGLQPDFGGTVRLGGDPIGQLSARERARRAAYLPQEAEIAWPVAVEEVVSLGRRLTVSGASRLTAEDRSLIGKVMERMQVADFRGRLATQLSAGERSRVLIARALAQDTPLLVADEPSAGLDPGHQISLMEVFAELARDGRGVLTSLHDLGLAARWCDRIIMMRSGRVIVDGPPIDVLTRENLVSVFGIEAHLSRYAGGLLVTPVGLANDREAS